MPELPEVEVTRASLAPRIGQARIQAVRVGKPLRWPLGIAPDHLVGLQLGVPARRGKYLWLPLHAPADSDPVESGQVATVEGSDDLRAGLLLHLGMSGSLRFGSDLGPAGAHDHFELTTDRGVLRLTDPRRFGAVLWSPGLDLAPASRLLAGLGVEPLEPAFSAAVLHRGLTGRTVCIKQALLAGDVVVGVGNIYCSEALFEAGIDPRTAARRIGPLRCERLVRAIRSTLQRALAAGGSTLRDFRDSHGMGGEFQLQARVYGRAGEACRVCAKPIRRILQGQRATYFCGQCQRR
jgi:formamidopyrimidine-DNA glycosylase